MEEEAKINQAELSTAEKIFHSLDQNKDGFLDENDLDLVIKELKLKISEEKLKKIFTSFKSQNSVHLDKGSVKISLQEFTYWWNNMRDTSELEFLSYLQAQAYNIVSMFQSITAFSRTGTIAPSEYDNDLSTGLLRVATGSLKNSYATAINLGLNMEPAEGPEKAKRLDLLAKLGLKPEDDCILLIKFRLGEGGLKDQAGAQTNFQNLMKSITTVSGSLNKTAKEILKLLTLAYKVHDGYAYIIVKPAESIRKNLLELYNLIQEHLNKFQMEEKTDAEIAFSTTPLEFLDKLNDSPHEAVKALLGCFKLEIRGYIKKIFQKVFQEMNEFLAEKASEEGPAGFATMLEDSSLLSILLQSLKVDLLIDDPSEYILQKEELMMPLLQLSAIFQEGNKYPLPSMPIIKKTFEFIEKYLEGGLGAHAIVDRLSFNFDLKVNGFMKIVLKICSIVVK